MNFKTLAIGALLAFSGMAQAATLTLDGGERSYLVHRPAGLDRSKQAPLVVMLHGALGTGSQAEKSYHWDDKADAAGFVVVYPDGTRRTWNAGGTCCGPSHRSDIKDVAFLDRLIETVSRDENIDPKRIYLTGISNGAAMAYRYACEGSVKLAAIGPVAGSFAYSCNKPPAVSVLAIHGLEDKTIPFAGGAGRRAKDIIWLPVQASLDTFRDADVCNAPTLKQTGVVVTSTASCDKGREVVLITVADGGHQWPGSAREKGVVAKLLLDPPSTALDATDALWNFFARHKAE